MKSHFYSVLALSLLACGGGGGGTIDANIIRPDARVTIDSGPMIDAMVGPMIDAGVTPSMCNPVNNVGCDGAAGEACDLDGTTNSFVCFPAPNDVLICGACDNAAGPFCAADMHCLANKCTHWCCTSADCGTGTCQFTTGTPPVAFPSGVGICTDAAGTMASCDSPATPPSNGTCYTP